MEAEREAMTPSLTTKGAPVRRNAGGPRYRFALAGRQLMSGLPIVVLQEDRTSAFVVLPRDQYEETFEVVEL